MLQLALMTDSPVIETMVAIALIMLVLDTFIATEFISHLAIATLCFAVYWWLDEWSLVWRILATVVSWFAIVLIYYYVFRQLGQKFANNVFARTRFKDSYESIVGKQGLIETIEGKPMCRVNDSLFPIEGSHPPSGSGVTITEVISGKLKVEED